MNESTLSPGDAEALVLAFWLAHEAGHGLSDQAVRQTVAALCKLILEPDR